MNNKSSREFDTSPRIFQRERFQLSQPVAVAEKHLIKDETGKPLLVVKCPSRLRRLIVAVLMAFLALMIFLLIGIVGLAELHIFDVILMAMATLFAAAAA